jgi:hypothetical protein
MNTTVSIVGVYPIGADEPVHLVEIRLRGSDSDFDFSDVEQEDVTQPRENWQVAYDEQLIDESNDEKVYVFFFHNLDFKKPLRTSLGELKLPLPSKLPPRLKTISYDPP